MSVRRFAAMVWCVGCVRARTATAPTPPTVVRVASVRPDAVQTEALWQTFPDDALPTPVTGLDALDDGTVVAVAAGGVYHLDRRGRATALCPVDTLPREGRALTTDGATVALLGGTAAEPQLLRATRGPEGWRCTRSEVETLLARDVTPGALGARLGPGGLALWSVGGALRLTPSATDTWVRLPPIAQLVQALATPVGVWAITEVGPARQRLWVLPSGATRWQPVSGAESLVPPVHLAPGLGGALRGLDRLRRWTATPAGLAAGRALGGPQEGAVPCAAWRDDEAVVAVAGGLVHTRGEAVEALPALPALHPAVALALTADGARWATDGRDVFRAEGAGDSPWQEVTARPLLQRRVGHFAAAGDALLVVAPEGAAALSRDGGRGWQRARVPPEASPVLAAAVSAEGVAAVASPRVFARWDRDGWTVHPLPPRAPWGLRRATGLYAFGSRWVLVDDGVYTSDDDGARWTLRFGPTLPPAAESDEAAGEATPRVLASARSAEGELVVLDGEARMWRASDGAGSFERWGNARLAAPAEGFHAPPRLAVWGESAARVHRGALVTRDADPVEAPFVPTFLGYSAAGHLLAAAEGRAMGGCRGDTLRVFAAGRWVPIPEACAHTGAAFAQDGDTLLVLRPDGAVARASMTALARSALRPP